MNPELPKVNTDKEEILKSLEGQYGGEVTSCLLYTSDAADERSSVDLGGRRIIKKKKNDLQDGYSKYT